MSSARYFVFERRGEWVVMLDGAAIARHRSREAALGAAIVMAQLMGSMQHDADVMLEADGELSLAWTYGVDPIPDKPGAAA